MAGLSTRVTLFGGLSVEQGDRVIDRFRTHKTAALLAYLVLHADREHSRESLAELLWPESAGASARNNVSVALSSLRNQLETPGLGGQSLFLGDRNTVALDPDRLSSDVADFQRHRRAAGLTIGLAQREHLAAAAELYRAPMLVDHLDAWVLAERGALQAAFVRVVDSLGSLCLLAGDLPAAMGVVRQASLAEPELDELQLALARLLVAAGQQPEAVLLLESLHTRRSADGFATAPELLAYLHDLRSAKAAAVPAAALPPVPNVPVAAAVEPLPGLGTVTLAVAEARGGLAASRAQRWAALGAAHGGRAIPWGDDALAMIFGRGTDASEFAIAVVLGELGATSDADLATAPRLALHTGEVLAQASPSPTGPLEHLKEQARQLLLAGHPGQILCSETTAALVANLLGPGAWAQSLGLHRLRERARPERVHQLCHAELAPNRFGALFAPTGFADHLPHLLTRFHGRVAEQTAIEALLLDDRVRLVTLTGPGGMGKTRLSIETGRRLLETYQGAIWFVPLAEIRDPALIGGALREALGIAVTSGSRPEQEVREFLSRQRSLLLLDNFEQLTESGSGIVQGWLEAVPNLAILVTSRQALGLPGEVTLPIPPLALPEPPFTLAETGDSDSVRLFLDRAREARPDFHLDDDNITAVATLCRRLGGLPLAIELAAARAQVLAPAQVLARLDRALDFLVSRQRNVPERHRTLRATLDWSFELLRPDLRAAFAQLSIFAGGWSLEDAEAVCDDPLILDALTELRGCSLITVNHGATVRYGMLEAVRDYAGEFLDPAARAALAQRHLDCFAALAEAGRLGLEKDDNSWLERLEAEQENLRAAFDFALHTSPAEALTLAGALWRFWLIRGHWDEARTAFETALQRTGEQVPAELRAKVYGWLGHLTYRQADYSAARHYLGEGLALSESLSDERGVGHALNELGKVAWAVGDHAEARQRYEAALAIRRRSGNDWSIAASLGNLGSVASAMGDPQAAVAYLEESLAIRERLGDERGVASSLNNLGVVYRSLGDYAAAAARLAGSLAIRRRLQDQQGVALSLSDLGVVAQEQSNYEAAEELHQESLAIRRMLGDRRGMAASLNNLGVLALAKGDHLAADRAYRESLALRREIGDQLGLALALNNLGDLAAALGEVERSRQLYEESLQLQVQLGNRSGQALALVNLGLAELVVDQPVAARERLEAADELMRQGEAPWLRGYLERGLGEVAAALGDRPAAHGFLRQSIADHAQCGDRAGLADSLEGLARLHVADDRASQAAELLGCAGALRGALSHPRLAVEQARFRSMSADLAALLGPDAFAAALELGAAAEWTALLSSDRDQAVMAGSASRTIPGQG